MDIKVLIATFVDDTKGKIIELAKTELANEEKKHALDECITEKVKELLKQVKLGVITKWALSKLLIPNIPVITQHIYDLLKAKIEGITK